MRTVDIFEDLNPLRRNQYRVEVAGDTTDLLTINPRCRHSLSKSKIA